jgi:MFS family permease
MLAQYRAIFNQPSQAMFWGGFTFSALGDAMTRVALTWYVYEQTQSAQALAWLTVCYTGPILVGGLVAGTLLDRFDRRQVMVWDNVLRGLAVASVPVAQALGVLTLAHVYAVAAAYGLLMMISLAGGPALIPSLVEPEHLSTANALETLSYTVGGILGPLVAGVLIAWVGAPNVVIVDAVSYLAFALALARVPLRPAADEADRVDAPAYHLGHAVQLMLSNKVLLSTTLMYLAANIGGGGLLSVWLPILSDQTLHGGPELYGTLLGALAVGEVVSAFLAGGRRWTLSLGTLICSAQMLSGLALALLVFRPTVVSVMAGLALFGAFSAPLTIWAQTLRMRIIPERLRGRTFALLRMLMQSGNPIGGGLAGVLLPALGLTAVIAVSAALVGVPGLMGYRVKELRVGGGK